MKFLVTVLVLVAAIGKSADIAPGVRANIGKSSLKFTENKGQVLGPDGAPHPEIDFVTGKGGLTIFIGENGLSYQVRKNNYRDTKNNNDGKKRRQEKELLSTETFRM